MKVRYIGDGTSSPQTLTYPGGVLYKWQEFVTSELPEWVLSAPPGTFLIDGRLNPGPSKPKPKPPAPKPGKEKDNG